MLTRLLRADPRPHATDDLAAWFAAHRAEVAGVRCTFERAALGGLHADRLGFAFAAGYREALAALVPALPEGALAALCATEATGNRPRDLATTLAGPPGGPLRLNGRKTWITLGARADVLLVVAVVPPEGPSGPDPSTQRPRLQVVRVPRDRDGVRIVPMPETAFVPEIPHAEVILDGVVVEEDEILPGDGYDAYLKPFRTVEDLHVHGALLGFLIGVARRHGFPHEEVEELVALAVAARALVAEPRLDPATHVALAGTLELARRAVERLEPRWALVDAETRARWERDRPLLAVAGRAREARRASAWARLAG